MEDYLTTKIIAVILHGYAVNIGKYCSLKDMISNTYQGAEILFPKMPLSVFSSVMVMAL